MTFCEFINFKLSWSYILDYENSKNPFQERKIRINGWRKYAFQYIDESAELLKIANYLNQMGLQKIVSLHISCAIQSKCDHFLTTDDKVLKRNNQISDIHVTDPISFIKEVLS